MSITTTTKILIVDDEPNIVTALDYLITKAGYQTSTVYNGEAALQMVNQFQPNLIILDVMMPKMNGFEVAAQIRSQPNYNDIKIIFLTAKGTERDKMQGYMTGGDIYLTKPFDNEDLLNLIRETIEFG